MTNDEVKAAVARLVALVGPDVDHVTEELDEEVHMSFDGDAINEFPAEEDWDAEEEILDTYGEDAADVNNGGLENQLAYLLRSNARSERELADIIKGLKADV